MNITITVEDREGDVQTLEAPTDMGLNLMEFLKASEYAIVAACGGMAMCGTCHVQVVHGLEKLPEKGDAEMDMLDTLPDADDDSRLACQLKLDPAMEGAYFKLLAEEEEL